MVEKTKQKLTAMHKCGHKLPNSQKCNHYQAIWQQQKITKYIRARLDTDRPIPMQGGDNSGWIMIYHFRWWKSTIYEQIYTLIVIF